MAVERRLQLGHDAGSWAEADCALSDELKSVPNIAEIGNPR
jgi:hypothetical protein